jgi:hypothetical protein
VRAVAGLAHLHEPGVLGEPAGVDEQRDAVPPAGLNWVNPVDDTALYQLDSSAGYILVWGKPAIAERTAACEETPAVGLGNAPSDWIEFVTNHPGIVATNVHAVVVGGYSGHSADLTTLSSWTSPCAEDDFFPNLVQFIVNSVPSPAGIYGVTNEVPIRLVALDVNGQTVLVTYYGNDGRFAQSVIRAQSVIDSMRFCFEPIGEGCAAGADRSPST